MSVLHIKQIDTKIFPLHSHIDVSDIGDSDKERDIKIKTRCLAAYAILNLIDCTEAEAGQSIVDGGDDNGIDAIYYSDALKKIILVQAKWSKEGNGEPDCAAISKFCQGIRDLLNLKFDRFNDKINQKRSVIESAINGYGTKFHIVLIDTHTALKLSKHSQRLIEDLLNEMNNTGDTNAEKLLTFERINQSKLHSSLANSAGNSPINVELGLYQWGIVSDPYTAYYGMVSGKEISLWWNKYNVKLFDKNIRKVLGQTEVNEEIKKTLVECPHNFWYFNNGITIIVEKAEKAPAGGSSKELALLNLSKISIVNGAQTVSTIGKFGEEVENEQKLDKVQVHVRIIQTSEAPEDFDKEVTRTNNRQNRIENRDFVSQDQEQIRLQTELRIDEIFYNIKRTEAYSKTDKSFDLIDATVSLACVSGKPQLAVLAKSGIGKFFENTDRGIYKEIFNPQVSGYFVYNSVLFVRKVDDLVNQKIEKLSRRSGRDYGLLVHGNRILSLLVAQKLNIKPKLNTIDFKIDDIELQNSIDDNIDNMQKFLDDLYPDSIIGTLFKNISKCSEMVDHILNKS